MYTTILEIDTIYQVSPPLRIKCSHISFRRYFGTSLLVSNKYDYKIRNNIAVGSQLTLLVYFTPSEMKPVKRDKISLICISEKDCVGGVITYLHNFQRRVDLI